MMQGPADIRHVLAAGKSAGEFVAVFGKEIFKSFAEVLTECTAFLRRESSGFGLVLIGRPADADDFGHIILSQMVQGFLP